MEHLGHMNHSSNHVCVPWWSILQATLQTTPVRKGLEPSGWIEKLFWIFVLRAVWNVISWVVGPECSGPGSNVVSCHKAEIARTQLAMASRMCAPFRLRYQSDVVRSDLYLKKEMNMKMEYFWIRVPNVYLGWRSFKQKKDNCWRNTDDNVVW